MKKTLYLCCAALMMLLASCDKDATNVKIEKVTGTYKGDLYAALYMPDYKIEQVNILINENNSEALAEDTIVNGALELVFSSDDKANFNMKNLSGVKFRIPYLDYYCDPDDITYSIAYLRDIYSGGAFAKVYEIVTEHFNSSLSTASTYADSVNVYEKYFGFIEKAAYLEDTISFNNLKCRPLMMREMGAVISTYDFEQNSFYERVYLDDFTFERKSNITSIIAYVENMYAEELSAEEKVALKELKGKIIMQGTVKNASGWCYMSYANYRPWIDLTIDKAPGILDVLTTALFGKGYDDKPLWFEIEYEGSIDLLDSYVRTE